MVENDTKQMKIKSILEDSIWISGVFDYPLTLLSGENCTFTFNDLKDECVIASIVKLSKQNLLCDLLWCLLNLNLQNLF